MPDIIVQDMTGHPEWIEPCSIWWHRQWGEGMGYTIETARTAIEGLFPDSRQAALIALVDGVPAGSVFLVEKDFETHAHLKPWLAGLFVLPAFRRMGLGERLTTAGVARAAQLGYASIYLYTSIGDFYRQQGWTTREQVTLHGVAHEVMSYTV